MKNRWAAAFLAFGLGSIGINNFYTNHPVDGVFDILFCWTGVPIIINIVRGCRYVWCNTDEEFVEKYVAQ